MRDCFIVRFFWALLTMPLSFLIVVIARLLRPWLCVRFGTLIGIRIGHFAQNTELYLCGRDAGIQGKNSLDIFRISRPVCNRQLEKMWRRRLHIINFPRWVEPINRALPGGSRHQIELPSDRDMHNFLSRTEAHLVFSAEEERRGRDELLRIGVKEGAPFICFHARDPAYLDAVRPQTNWDYHDYRDFDIHDTLPAVTESARRGYFSVRMGAVVQAPLSCDNPMVIDYATKYRSDFMDIYLLAKCRFFLCATTGLSGIPMVWRKPVAYVNFIPLGHLIGWGAQDIIIFKKLKMRGQKRFLSFREILDSQIEGFLETGQYEAAGIEIVNNTPEEITAAAVEMEQRLEGSWQENPEDEQLQQRFRALFKPGGRHGKILARVGAEFLRQNQELLA